MCVSKFKTLVDISYWPLTKSIIRLQIEIPACVFILITVVNVSCLSPIKWFLPMIVHRLNTLNDLILLSVANTNVCK